MEEKKELWKGIFYVVVGIILCVKILDSCVSCDSDKEQLDETTIEQVEETDAERQAREEKEEAERQARKKQEKREKVKREAYRWGKIAGTSYSYGNAVDDCKSTFLTIFGNPTSAEDKELYETFKEIYMKTWEEYHNAKNDM